MSKTTDVKLGKIRHQTPGPGEYNVIREKFTVDKFNVPNPTFPRAKREYKFPDLNKSAGPAAYCASPLRSSKTISVPQVRQ
jgi:hypothetical protein